MHVGVGGKLYATSSAKAAANAFLLLGSIIFPVQTLL